MKVSINIKVRNAEWYYSNGELGDYLQEFQMINEGKIPLHVNSTEFEYTQDVKSYKISDSPNYRLNFYSVNDLNERDDASFLLEDVTVAEFELDDAVSTVVVANELIYQSIAAKKRGTRYYWYFYIKEDASYVKLLDNIWITEEHFNALSSAYTSFLVPIDENLTIRSVSGVINGISVNS